ncbi:MAG: leucine-rich repeat protein [Coriobacteriia bacterium]|nr:leucine-rich repeat protein [Coriobacteriia bacterium]
MRGKTKVVSLVVAMAMLGQLAGLAYGEVVPAGAGNAQAAPLAVAEDNPRFQLTVTIPAGGATFILPTSSNLGGMVAGKPYNWLVDWGDGNTELAQGESSSGGGVTHGYGVAGDFTITITPNGQIWAWLAAFGFTRVASGFEGSNAATNKELVTSVAGPLTPEMTRNYAQLTGAQAAPDYEWAYMFYGCTNMREVPSVEGWELIESTGHLFAFSMFVNCSSLLHLTNSFNLPEGILSTGSYFASYMFTRCTNLTSLPARFNLPQGITHTDVDFAYNMFSECHSLKSLPAVFNLPQHITEADEGFAVCMFAECYSIERLPAGFNLPQDMSKVGSYFASSMFFRCESLIDLPEGFNLPPAITEVDDAFAAGMFSWCYSLNSLPEGFNLPQGITLAGRDFAREMFTSSGSSSFQVNSQFCFPLTIAADCPDAFYRTFLLNDAVPVQNRTATSIIGSCPTPLDERETFGRCFPDYGSLPLNWGGARPVEVEPVLRIAIRIPVRNFSFVLPTSGYLNSSYYGMPYNWYISWGDGNSEVSSGFSESNSGIAHTYAGTGDYTVTIRPVGSNEAWLAAFGFAGTENYGSKALLTGVLDPLRPEMTRTKAQIDGSLAPPDNEWYRAFINCAYLTTIPTFEGWEAIGSVGDNFASEMFSDCYSLVTLPDNFNLPQGLTRAGDNFAALMFSNCTNLVTLSPGFNLPQGLTEVGDSFASGLFRTCGGIRALPTGFTFPQGLTKVGDNFARTMFLFCTSLDMLPLGFNLPQGLTRAGDYFASDMFSSCTSLISLPEGFNLPPGITETGDWFAGYLFYNCLSLTNLPLGFNLPQGITSVGERFAVGMFRGAGSSHFHINDEFCLPAGVPAECEYAFGMAFVLSNNAPVQNRTAASIIGSCPSPNAERHAFDTHYIDIDFIPVNWGGGGLTPPPVGEPGSGDLNGDGLVTMDEVIITLWATIGSVPLSREQIAAIDMDFDGEITMGDVILTLQKTV